MHFNNSKKGFLLVEMLVAMAVFAIIAIAMTSIFLTITNTQKRVKISQEVLNNAQYAIELMSREIKNNEIIYFGANTCSDLGDPYNDACLMFVRQNGETAAFAYDATTKTLVYEILDCSLISGNEFRSSNEYRDCVPAATEPVKILSPDVNNVTIDKLNFIIKPIANPYYYDDDDPLHNQQPLVTINLTVDYQSTKPIEMVTHTLQTTVSSRIYKR